MIFNKLAHCITSLLGLKSDQMPTKGAKTMKDSVKMAFSIGIHHGSEDCSMSIAIPTSNKALSAVLVMNCVSNK